MTQMAYFLFDNKIVIISFKKVSWPTREHTRAEPNRFHQRSREWLLPARKGASLASARPFSLARWWHQPSLSSLQPWSWFFIWEPLQQQQQLKQSWLHILGACAFVAFVRGALGAAKFGSRRSHQQFQCSVCVWGSDPKSTSKWKSSKWTEPKKQLRTSKLTNQVRHVLLFLLFNVICVNTKRKVLALGQTLYL